MTTRQTPFRKIRYPWASDVVNVADVQSMGADIDQALVQTANLAFNFSRFASVIVKRTAAQSLAKGALTAISFDSAVLNNGANSPLSNGAWWTGGAPTRLTAPTACVVLASTFGTLNAGSAMGTPSAVQSTVTLNGAVTQPGIQGTKYAPTATQSGQIFVSALTMWKLNAGDYLEMKMYWTGTPAGPFNTDTSFPPTLMLMMVALPTVP